MIRLGIYLIYFVCYFLKKNRPEAWNGIIGPNCWDRVFLAYTNALDLVYLLLVRRRSLFICLINRSVPRSFVIKPGDICSTRQGRTGNQSVLCCAEDQPMIRAWRKRQGQVCVTQDQWEWDPGFSEFWGATPLLYRTSELKTFSWLVGQTDVSLSWDDWQLHLETWKVTALLCFVWIQKPLVSSVPAARVQLMRPLLSGPLMGVLKE